MECKHKISVSGALSVEQGTNTRFVAREQSPLVSMKNVHSGQSGRGNTPKSQLKLAPSFVPHFSPWVLGSSGKGSVAVCTGCNVYSFIWFFFSSIRPYVQQLTVIIKLGRWNMSKSYLRWPNNEGRVRSWIQSDH